MTKTPLCQNYIGDRLIGHIRAPLDFTCIHCGRAIPRPTTLTERQRSNLARLGITAPASSDSSN